MWTTCHVLTALGTREVALDDEVAVGHWWLRTPESATNAWIVAGASALGWGNLTFDFVSWGVRPALIIYQ